MRSRRLAAPAVLLLGACSLAPRYQRPAPPIAGEWGPEQAGTPAAFAAADLGWRDVFGDERYRYAVDALRADAIEFS